MPHVTRFRGTKRPFLGEKLEGDANTMALRGTKRKVSGPYPSPSPTPPKKSRKRQRSRAPSPPSCRYNDTSSSSRPTDGSNNDIDMDRNDSDNRDYLSLDAIEENNESVYLDPNYSFDQPVGSGPGLREDSEEPDPIHNVKRINCRFRIPGTELMEHRKDGKTTVYGGPDDPIFKVKRINCRYRIPGTKMMEHWREGEMSICGQGWKPWLTPLSVMKKSPWHESNLSPVEREWRKAQRRVVM
ncbi:MAG: hypothetical protein Q9224_004854 [Gallowayella concinna]